MKLSKTFVVVATVLCLWLNAYLGDDDNAIDHKKEKQVKLQNATTNISTSTSTEDNYKMLEKGICPPVIVNRKGIYKDKSKQKGLENVILLTGSNYQFSHFFENWKLVIAPYGYDYLFLSMDQDIHNYTKDDILLPDTLHINQTDGFRSPSYNRIVANKIRLILLIQNVCRVDILFSDVDNVFLKDPLQHDLGRMIRSGRFDYIYQVNEDWPQQPRKHSCIAEGVSVREGNTGFHYLKASTHIRDLLFTTITLCDHPDNTYDDQKILWYIIRKFMKFGRWKHCPANTILDLEQNKNNDHLRADNNTRNQYGNFCCMDPYYYTSGKSSQTGHQLPPWDVNTTDQLVSFHANYAILTKVKKLKTWVKGGWLIQA